MREGGQREGERVLGRDGGRNIGRERERGRMRAIKREGVRNH